MIKLLVEYICKRQLQRTNCCISALEKVFISVGLFVFLLSGNIENCYANNMQYKEGKRTGTTLTSQSTNDPIWEKQKAWIQQDLILGNSREGRLYRYHRSSLPYSTDITEEAHKVGFGDSKLDNNVVSSEQVGNLRHYRSSKQDKWSFLYCCR